MNEMNVGELGASGLALCPLDSIAGNVDPEADAFWKRLSVGGEEMTVTAADFPYERGGARKNFAQQSVEISTTLLQRRQMICCP